MAMALTINGINVYKDGDHLWWVAGLAIDADGCPEAYHPDGSPPGLDSLKNAGHTGNWYGVVTNTGDSDGTPVVQGAGAPCPGFLVSQTKLQNHGFDRCDPRRYVDSARMPYITVPPEVRQLGVGMGDVGMVYYRKQSSACVVADVGPRNRIGEGSMALARLLGIFSDPKHGGAESGVECHVWLGSTKGWPRSWSDVVAQSSSLAICCQPAIPTGLTIA